MLDGGQYRTKVLPPTASTTAEATTTFFSFSFHFLAHFLFSLPFSRNLWSHKSLGNKPEGAELFLLPFTKRGGTWKTRAKRRKCDWKSHVRRRVFLLHVQCSIRHKEKKSNLVDFPHFLWDISGCACVCMNAQMESGRRRRQKTLHYATNVFGVLFFLGEIVPLGTLKSKVKGGLGGDQALLFSGWVGLGLQHIRYK